MKHTRLLCLLILFVLSVKSASASRLLISAEPAAPPSDGIHKVDAISKYVGREGKAGDNPWQLMGMEECKNGDEECEKRRLLSEAHLDYIYTQGHHKP